MATHRYEVVEPSLSKNYFWNQETNSFQPLPTAAELDQLLAHMEHETGVTLSLDGILSTEASYRQASSLGAISPHPQNTSPYTSHLRDNSMVLAEDVTQNQHDDEDYEIGMLIRSRKSIEIRR